MRLTKAERAMLREKFCGRCAYCGCELGERWHADHHVAVLRNIGGEASAVPMNRPEHDHVDNLMPSCPPCNISKGQLTIEQWRGWIAGHVASLNNHQSTYRLCRAHGLIVETDVLVVFYFERAIGAGSGS